MRNSTCCPHRIPAPATQSSDWVDLAADSPKDKPWDEHRALADKIMALATAAEMDKEAARIRDCSEALFFRLNTCTTTGEVLWKLHSAPFCHYRHCPICAWRRSLKSKAIFLSAMPMLVKQYPSDRFLLLTLTVRNCPLSELRSTISAMNKGFQRLIQRKNWPARGWVRATEVTAGNDGPMQAHPHFHVLLQVPASYFSGPNYVKQAEWVERWREAMRLDYEPQVDIRVLKPRKGPIEAPQGTQEPSLVQSSGLYVAAAELLKYSTKSTDLLKGGPSWFREYAEQVHALKFLTSGGCLQGIMKDVREGDDLVHVNGENADQMEDEDEDGERLAYHWRKAAKQYQRRRR